MLVGIYRAMALATIYERSINFSIYNTSCYNNQLLHRHYSNVMEKKHDDYCSYQKKQPRKNKFIRYLKNTISKISLKIDMFLFQVLIIRNELVLEV